MNFRKTAFLAWIGGLLGGASMLALAIEPQAQSAPADAPAFEELDKDTSGAITPDEAMESWLADAFAQVDANRDGFVTKAEYTNATG